MNSKYGLRFDLHIIRVATFCNRNIKNTLQLNKKSMKTYNFSSDEFRRLVFEQEFASENNETVIVMDDAVNNIKNKEDKK